MSWRRVLSRLRALFRRPRLADDLKAEIRSHLEMEERENAESGMAPDEAHYAALRRFGNVTLAQERSREMWIWNTLETLLQDLHDGLRQLRRSPGFTATAIAALALGIGATTAIFSVISTVLLQPLAYPHPNRIVRLAVSSPQGKGYVLSIPLFMAMSQAKRTLHDFALYETGLGINLTGGGRPEQVQGIQPTANYFKVFGAPFALGRPFTSEDDRPHGPHVVVISYGLWRSRFGGSPSVVGQAIELGGQPYVITGVLGRDFHPGIPADIWIPLQFDPNNRDIGQIWAGAALLKRGASLAAANAELKLAVPAFKREFPQALSPRASFATVPLREVVVGNVRPALLILQGAVCFVLLIACANVASLLLARATLRKREIAIRAAVGAGHGRIIRQLLTESVLLSIAGGAVGLVLGFVGMRWLLAIDPGNIPRIGERGSAVALDWRVLLFTIGVAIVTGILFGLFPALNASRTDLHATLKESGARAGTGLRQNKSRSALVIIETALALVLLAGAALLIRTFVAMRSVDPGFDPHHILTMEMSLTGPRFEKTAGVAQMVREAQQRVGSIPGVVAVSASIAFPLVGQPNFPFNITGRPLTGKSPWTGAADWDSVSPEFFNVFRIPLLRGRMFTDRDDASAPQVVIIDEAMARKYWPKSNPLGKQILIGKGVGPELDNEPAREIAGVVGDVRDNGVNHNPPPIMYVPEAQVTDGLTALDYRLAPILWSVRSKVPPFSLSTSIRKQLRIASGGLPVAHIQSMDQIMEESTARTSFNMALLTIFAGVALLLAGIGIYGLVAYSVEQRTQEIGIRMALGASPQGVRSMIVRQGMRPVLMGVGIGVVAALGLTRLLATMLYGVKPWDPLVFISVAVMLSLIALLATYLPARRAAKVDPMVALRYE
jgi:putative ABC transport system permease protein